MTKAPHLHTCTQSPHPSHLVWSNIGMIGKGITSKCSYIVTSIKSVICNLNHSIQASKLPQIVLILYNNPVALDSDGATIL
jgi:uncharacterized protein involved in propanediol utilization